MAPKKPAAKKPVAKQQAAPARNKKTAAPGKRTKAAAPARRTKAAAPARKKAAAPARKQTAAPKASRKPRVAPGKLVDPKGRGDITDAIALAAGEAATFTVAATVAYQKASWDVGKLDGPVDCAVGGLVGQVPKAWGAPAVGGGALTWTLNDGLIRLFSGPRTAPVPTLEQWAGMRRQVITDDWLIIGQAQLDHPSGAVAYETAEVCAVEPRAVRVVRALFVPSSFATFALVCPGAIPTARGRELAQAFRTLEIAAHAR